MTRRRVTLAQVAAEAGVAVSTASLVLSGRGTSVRISTQSQQRVNDAAKRLGYRPNAVSVGLRKGTTSTLGFVSDTVASSRLAGEMIKGAIAAARDRGYMLFVAETGGNLSQESLLLEAMSDRQVDGIILAAMFTQERTLPEGLDPQRTVLLNIGPPEGNTIPTVLPSELEAGRAAGRMLIDARHRNIHLLGAGPTAADFPPKSLAGRLRLQGLLEVLAEKGVQPASGYMTPHWLPADGYQFMQDILSKGVPDAIVTFNDRLAMGAYQAMQEGGLRIPDDVSVVSFDDASIAGWLRPGLTTFALPHRLMGKRAADLLIDSIERSRGESPSPAPEPGPHLIPLPLRERESVAPAKSR